MRQTDAVCFRAFILCTGLDVASFTDLLERFEPAWLTHRPVYEGKEIVCRVQKRSTRGRHRILRADAGLALILHWLRSKCHMWTLSLIFGLVPSGVSHWVQFGLLVLHHALWHLEEAEVRWPDSIEEFEAFASMTLKFS